MSIAVFGEKDKVIELISNIHNYNNICVGNKANETRISLVFLLYILYFTLFIYLYIYIFCTFIIKK